MSDAAVERTPLQQMRMLRLFIAVSPSEAVRDALAEVQAQLRPRLPPRAIKWTPPEQVHLTLRFLGDVPEAAVNELGSAIASVAATQPGFELVGEGLGVFPNPRRPRVAWVGLGGGTSDVAALQSAVQAATAHWGEPENKPFNAHLTLGRVRDLPPAQLREVSAVLACFDVGRLGAWTVRAVELFRSDLRPEGALHTQLGSFALSGSIRTKTR